MQWWRLELIWYSIKIEKQYVIEQYLRAMLTSSNILDYKPALWVVLTKFFAGFNGNLTLINLIRTVYEEYRLFLLIDWSIAIDYWAFIHVAIDLIDRVPCFWSNNLFWMNLFFAEKWHVLYMQIKSYFHFQKKIYAFSR